VGVSRDTHNAQAGRVNESFTLVVALRQLDEVICDPINRFGDFSGSRLKRPDRHPFFPTPGERRHRIFTGNRKTALGHMDGAYAQWRGQLAGVDAEAFTEPIGPAAGPYGDSTRRSFALHIADEFIHHVAEASLLRDLYASLG
jgi:hypothetical protein